MRELFLTDADNIEKAVAALTEPAVVYLKTGIYRQKIVIAADNVTLVGEDREKTVITFDDYARKIHADGNEYNTFRTYTLCVTGKNVKLQNLTVENSNTDPITAGQCVALSVHGKLFRAENVDLRSLQDTLFLSPFPDDLVLRYRNFLPRAQLYAEGGNLHLFRGCRIFGSVDFVFGGARALFYGCDLVSLYDGRNEGFVAAPCHPLAEEVGFVFAECSFKNGGAKERSVFLARPWRDFGKCAFINCALDGHINPALFDKWNDTARDKTARFWYRGLSGAELAPADWAKELSAAQVSSIINYCNEKFNS